VDLWRLIVMTMLPSWDIGESAAEMKRAYEIGHRAAPAQEADGRGGRLRRARPGRQPL